MTSSSCILCGSSSREHLLTICLRCKLDIEAQGGTMLKYHDFSEDDMRTFNRSHKARALPYVPLSADAVVPKTLPTNESDNTYYNINKTGDLDNKTSHNDNPLNKTLRDNHNDNIKKPAAPRRAPPRPAKVVVPKKLVVPKTPKVVVPKTCSIHGVEKIYTTKTSHQKHCPICAGYESIKGVTKLETSKCFQHGKTLPCLECNKGLYSQHVKASTSIPKNVVPKKPKPVFPTLKVGVGKVGSGMSAKLKTQAERASEQGYLIFDNRKLISEGLAYLEAQHDYINLKKQKIMEVKELTKPIDPLDKELEDIKRILKKFGELSEAGREFVRKKLEGK